MLRRSVITIYRQKLSNKERSSKMSVLYRFISSPAFQSKLEDINRFSDELLDIEVQEQSAHDKLWKKRGRTLKSLQRVIGDVDTEVHGILAGDTP